MKENNNTATTEEVDLSYLFKMVSNFFRSIARLLFLVISFFKKYIIITIVLIVAGVVLGYFLDKKSVEIYQNKIIVIPNFESVDYLYETVEEINAKIKSKDSVFLKGILDSDYKSIREVEIEAIPDIYNFIAQSKENIDVLRILFQNQDFNDFVEDLPTSKNYKYHKLNFVIKGTNSKSIIDRLIGHINKNEHFLKYQEVFQENTRLQIAQNELMLKQADSIIKAGSTLSSGGSDQSVVISDGRLDMILFRKQEMLDMILKLNKKLKDQDAIVMQVSANYNVLEKGILSVSNKFRLPFLFLFLFSFIFFLRYVYKRLKHFSESE